MLNRRYKAWWDPGTAYKEGGGMKYPQTDDLKTASLTARFFTRDNEKK